MKVYLSFRSFFICHLSLASFTWASLVFQQPNSTTTWNAGEHVDIFWADNNTVPRASGFNPYRLTLHAVDSNGNPSFDDFQILDNLITIADNDEGYSLIPNNNLTGDRFVVMFESLKDKISQRYISEPFSILGTDNDDANRVGSVASNSTTQGPPLPAPAGPAEPIQVAPSAALNTTSGVPSNTSSIPTNTTATNTESASSGSSGTHSNQILVIVAATLSSLLVLMLIGCFVCYRRRRARQRHLGEFRNSRAFLWSLKKRLGLSSSSTYSDAEDGGAQSGNGSENIMSPVSDSVGNMERAVSGRRAPVVPFPREKEPIVDPQPSKAELIREAERLAQAGALAHGPIDSSLLGWGLRLDTSTTTNANTNTSTSMYSPSLDITSPSAATETDPLTLAISAVSPRTTKGFGAEGVTEVDRTGFSETEALAVIARLQAEVEHHRRIAVAAQMGYSEPPPLYSPDS